MRPQSERERFFRFLAAGGIAAAANIASRIAFSILVPFEAAVVLAYAVGMIVAFTLNRMLVFEPSGRTIRDEGMRFALVNAVAAVQVWVVSVALARLVFPAIGFAWNAETIAHVAGVLSPIFTSYLGHKQFSFRAKS